MNKQIFSDAMSELNEKYVMEAADFQAKKRKPAWIKWSSLAACFCLCALLGVGAWQGGMFDKNPVLNEGIDPVGTENGEKVHAGNDNTLPSGPVVEDLPDDLDSNGWIVWQGKEYVQQSTSFEANEKLGQYLGAVTEFEGFYKNNAVDGSLYTVKGNDSILCAKLDNGAYIFLICLNEEDYDVPVSNKVGDTGVLKPLDAVWGGSYMDDNGNWVVWLTENTSQNRATVFAANPTIAESRTIFKKADYSLAYLTQLMADITEAMRNGSLSFVATASLREDINRISVAINSDDADARAKVLAFDSLGGAIEVTSGSTAITE